MVANYFNGDGSSFFAYVGVCPIDVFESCLNLNGPSQVTILWRQDSFTFT